MSLGEKVHHLTDEEPSDLNFALWERGGVLGWPYVGPLTQEQAEDEAAYERHMEQDYAEHLAQQAAGGRTLCSQCGQRAVVHQTVCTLGYPGHPGAEFSDYGRCEHCDHKEL